MAKLVGKDGSADGSGPERGVRGWVSGLALLVGVAVSGPGHALPEAPPLPPPRPDVPAARPDVPAPPPRPNENTPAKETLGPEAAEATDPAAAACIERLKTLGLRFEKHEPVQDNACGIKNPVSVSALPKGVIVVPESLMECSFAEGLTRWVDEIVLPRTSEHFQSAPTKLLIGTSYQCRDQTSGSKLSEHAFGNGVDVMGFEFDKHPPLAIHAQPEGSPEEAFQSAIRKEACTVFSTVLGPGAEDHEDHLHLDMRARKGDFRICQ